MATLMRWGKSSKVRFIVIFYSKFSRELTFENFFFKKKKYSGCSYKLKKSKEGTERITIHRDYGVRGMYTIEASFLGGDNGTFKGLVEIRKSQLSTRFAVSKDYTADFGEF